MDNVGYNDMMRMQSEAVQRVKEMQRRAHNAVQKANAQRAGRVQDQPENKGEFPRQEPPPINRNNARSTALPLDYLSSGNRPPKPDISTPHIDHPRQTPQTADNPPSAVSTDTDKLLIIVLILLLSQEEADNLLLMALGYLIM